MNEGYTGEDLITKYKEMKANIPHALNQMIDETNQQPFITECIDDYLNSIKSEEEDE